MKILQFAVGSVAVSRKLVQTMCFTCCRLRHCSTDTGTSHCKSPPGTDRRFNPRRAVLYVPGNDERKLLKLNILNVDCAVMDCEDGVAMNRKVEARETICKMLDQLSMGRSECAVRVNSVSSGLMEEDLNVIFQAAKLPETIMVPKVNNTQEVAAITHSIQSRLKTRTLDHKLSLILFMESAMGLLNLRDICNKATELSLRSSVFNVDGLVFGSDDYCADIGAVRSTEGSELLYARQKFVTIAKAYRLQAIDMVHIDYKDHVSLKEQSIMGANMGFTGKQVIHPSQIPIVQKAFSPSQVQIDWATQLVQAFEAHQSSGQGAFTFHGHMIDMPLLLQAKNTLRLSKAIQIL